MNSKHHLTGHINYYLHSSLHSQHSQSLMVILSPLYMRALYSSSSQPFSFIPSYFSLTLSYSPSSPRLSPPPIIFMYHYFPFVFTLSILLHIRILLTFPSLPLPYASLPPTAGNTCPTDAFWEAERARRSKGQINNVSLMAKTFYPNTSRQLYVLSSYKSRQR